MPEHKNTDFDRPGGYTKPKGETADAADDGSLSRDHEHSLIG